MNNSFGANFSQGSYKSTLVANGSERQSLFLAPSVPCDFGRELRSISWLPLQMWSLQDSVIQIHKKLKV